jgi:hypothetical protein
VNTFVESQSSVGTQLQWTSTWYPEWQPPWYWISGETVSTKLVMDLMVRVAELEARLRALESRPKRGRP